MSDAALWNLKATLLIVSSLTRYVDLRFPYLLWPFVDQVLNNLEEGLEQYKNFLNPLSRNLEEILAWNRWAISCKNIDLLNLKIQERLPCGEILIIKSYSQNVSAVVKEAQYTYFLVSALSCNGNIVYIWKDGAWKRESSDSSYSNSFYELYYFYYCKITPKSISKLLRLDDVCNTNDNLFQVMIKIWNFTKESKNIFDFDEEIEARMKYSGIIEKINKEKEDAQAEIARLESNNKNLESDIKKYKEYIEEYIEEYQRNENNLKNLNYSWEEKCKSLDNEHQKLTKMTKEKEESSNEAIKLLNQKIIDLQNEKNILEAENFYLKNSLSEKENLLQKASDEHHKISEKYNILQEKCKNLKEKLNKANYSQILYNPENEIVQLPPNTKHGLPNLGNTCYLNSLLQIFASTPLFVSKIASIDSPFCNSLSSLLSNMHIENSSKTISNLTRNFSKTSNGGLFKCKNYLD
ncbi:unnamed protein product [Blepharisma stoltei]|uniref:USP domain-containing protein n=1 Tax=Blepharisma stoltei TaxID=1481888 RepID=A0AAU9IE57_9CILI|nr:unnamed protein product [Blepharisma stoltei]